MIPVFLVAAAAAAPGWAGAEFLNALHKAETRGDAAERIEYLDRAIKAFEPDADDSQVLAHAYLLRGEARYWNADFAAAGADLAKALELDPYSSRAFLLRGLVSVHAGRAAAAVKDLHDYTVAKPEDLEGWLSLADAQARSGDLDAAGQSLRRAEQADSVDWRLDLARARLARANKEWSAALEAVERADSATKGRDPEVAVERAICLVAQGKPEDALREYDRAIPGLERLVSQNNRSKAHKIDGIAAREKAARGFFGRGRVNEFLTRVPEAVDDYNQSCGLGDAQACERAEALKAVPSTSASAPARSAGAERPEKPRKEKSRKTRVESDAGDRIYAN